MIKAAILKKDGGRVLLFGLSKENLKRLQKDQPIHIFLSELGNYSKDEIVIMYGETEQTITDDLKKMFPGLPDPATLRKDS